MVDIKKTVKNAADKIAETATNVGHKISEGAEKATDWVKEQAHAVGHRADEAAQKVKHATQPEAKGLVDSIQEQMEVIASCGTRIGKVDHVAGNTIKLTKNDPQAGGQHHFIPVDWVARVDQHVHLTKNSQDAMREWRGETAGTV